MPTFEDLEELKEVLKSIKDVKKKVLKRISTLEEKSIPSDEEKAELERLRKKLKLIEEWENEYDELLKD